jgi:hypothetical protein
MRDEEEFVPGPEKTAVDIMSLAQGWRRMRRHGRLICRMPEIKRRRLLGELILNPLCNLSKNRDKYQAGHWTTEGVL